MGYRITVIATQNYHCKCTFTSSSSSFTFVFVLQKRLFPVFGMSDAISRKRTDHRIEKIKTFPPDFEVASIFRQFLQLFSCLGKNFSNHFESWWRHRLIEKFANQTNISLARATPPGVDKAIYIVDLFLYIGEQYTFAMMAALRQYLDPILLRFFQHWFTLT